MELKEEQKVESVWDTLRFAGITLAILLPVRFFIAQPFIVSGASMVPTFQNGDYLIVDELSYRFHPPARGDVIIFRYPVDPSKFFIKRVIGLPGESLEIKNGSVSVQGTVLRESYLQVPTSRDVNLTLGSDEYFVMGDNRPASSDSRSWGPLPKDLIVGRALVRLFPFNEIGWSPGAAQEQ